MFFQLTVQEEYVARAILQLVEKSKYAVEGAGAVGLAAIIAGLVPELAGKKYVPKRSFFFINSAFSH